MVVVYQKIDPRADAYKRGPSFLYRIFEVKKGIHAEIIKRLRSGENLVLSPIAQTDIRQAQGFFTIRFWGAFAAVKYAAPFINEGGSIGLTSGTAGIRPGAGWSVASAICAAMEGFVRAMAVELSPIRVNCVIPGVIRTPLWDSMGQLERDKLFHQISNSSLVKRVGLPDDVAEGFLYLMKQRNGTGQSLLIDGGAVLV